jgi:hypothetical protein
MQVGTEGAAAARLGVLWLLVVAVAVSACITYNACVPHAAASRAVRRLVQVLRYLHDDLTSRLLPRVREEADAFEIMTEDTADRLKLLLQVRARVCGLVND